MLTSAAMISIAPSSPSQAPPLPLLVVIKITPFTPLESKIAVAAASLRISIDSMSCGLMSKIAPSPVLIV
jgi:hypothetical protein